MNFDKIIEKAKSGEMKSVVVAAAQDSHVLAAVSEAAAIGLVKPILVGNEDEIKKIIAEHSFKLQDSQIVHTDNDQMSAEVAVKMVSDKKADVLMKGLLGTATLLKAVLNKEWGLRTGNLLSHVGIIESKESADKLYFLTDGAMVMYPDLNQKVGLINNAVQVVRSFGIEVPKVACIAAVEVVNPDMPATLDAAALTMMNQRGQIKNCIVDGPLALDNAVSMEASQHKGISSPVAGQADILLVPNIEAGNILYKTSTYLGGCETAGLLAGAAAPIVLTSRADSTATKLKSIACAAVASQK